MLNDTNMARVGKERGFYWTRLHTSLFSSSLLSWRLEPKINDYIEMIFTPVRVHLSFSSLWLMLMLGSRFNWIYGLHISFALCKPGDRKQTTIKSRWNLSMSHPCHIMMLPDWSTPKKRPRIATPLSGPSCKHDKCMYLSFPQSRWQLGRRMTPQATVTYVHKCIVPDYVESDGLILSIITSPRLRRIRRAHTIEYYMQVHTYASTHNVWELLIGMVQYSNQHLQHKHWDLH